MALITLRQLLDHAAENSYGVAAFNINNLEQVIAVMAAASEVDSPVILQITNSARNYAGDVFIKNIISAAIEKYPNLPIVVHQDHAHNLSTCVDAIRNGFSSVMMDGSLLSDGKTPAGYSYNVDITKKVVGLSHAVGVSVEGELGVLGSLETNLAGEEDGTGAVGVLSESQLLTSPEQAVDFVNRTGVDALAIAIGTSHGAYKFKSLPNAGSLAISRVKEIQDVIPNTHLVMHGASSVPDEWVRFINSHGGNIGNPHGVPLDDIILCINNGIRKVNIDTDLRIAFTGSLRYSLARNSTEFDFRKFLGESILAMKSVCKTRYEAFGSAGQASRIQAKSIDSMIGFYHS